MEIILRNDLLEFTPLTILSVSVTSSKKKPVFPLAAESKDLPCQDTDFMKNHSP